MSVYANPCLASIKTGVLTRRQTGFLHTHANRVTSHIRHTIYRHGPKFLAMGLLLMLPGNVIAGSNIELIVRKTFAEVPVLVKIAKCESNFRQFDEDGRVLKNPDSSAIGLMQIMVSFHEREAKKLGYNLRDIHGNLAYARRLYERDGTTPWNASKSCWGKYP